MKILIYEDSSYKNLYPLNMLRATFDMRYGTTTIKERIEKIIGSKFEVTLHCRNEVAPYLKEVHKNKVNKITKDDYLLVNGKVIYSEDSLIFFILKKKKNSYYVLNGEIVAAYITKDRYELLKNKVESSKNNSLDSEFFSKLSLRQIKLKDNFRIHIINYPWDLIRFILDGGLINDIDYFLRDKKKFYKLKDHENFVNPKKIFAAKSVRLLSNVVLDASQGSIVIDENVTIEPFTYVRGPVFIGKSCLIKSGAKIYGPCVIGEYSKVGGEIAESIFHSYVNKQHEGFVGHSYICPFVNLGADTVTSDLKNNYTKIRIKTDDKEIDTDMQFLGSIIGDHSKTSINSMLNTGSIIGIFVNIFGSGFPDKEVKSFSWIEPGKTSTKYNLEKAIQTARIVMQRRGINMSAAYENLVKSYY